MLRVVRACLTALPLFAALTLCAEENPLPQPGSYEAAGFVEGSIRVTVMRARQIAIVKLRSAGCRSLFADYRDIPGRRLDEVLETLAESAPQHLSLMTFRDGAHRQPCGEPHVYAFTSPGSSTVYVCPAFIPLTRRDPRAAANLLIHEELHSLGAGEAPMPGLPSAVEITDDVDRRCGR